MNTFTLKYCICVSSETSPIWFNIFYFKNMTSIIRFLSIECVSFMARRKPANLMAVAIVVSKYIVTEISIFVGEVSNLMNN